MEKTKYLEFEDKEFQEKVEKEVLDRIKFHKVVAVKSIVAYIAHNFVQKETVLEMKKELDKVHEFFSRMK